MFWHRQSWSSRSCSTSVRTVLTIERMNLYGTVTVQQYNLMPNDEGSISRLCDPLWGSRCEIWTCFGYLTFYSPLRKLCCGCVYLKGRGWHRPQSIEKAQSCANMTAQLERKHAHLLMKYRCHYLTMAPVSFAMFVGLFEPV